MYIKIKPVGYIDLYTHAHPPSLITSFDFCSGFFLFHGDLLHKFNVETSQLKQSPQKPGLMINSEWRVMSTHQGNTWYNLAISFLFSVFQKGQGSMKNKARHPYLVEIIASIPELQTNPSCFLSAASTILISFHHWMDPLTESDPIF